MPGEAVFDHVACPDSEHDVWLQVGFALEQTADDFGAHHLFVDGIRHDVEEYCISEGWIRVALGKKVDRNGNPLTLKLVGPVEAWFERSAAGDEAVDGTSTDDAAADEAVAGDRVEDDTAR